jgi:hypothetical protein
VLIPVLLGELLYCDVLIKYYLCFTYLDLFEISFILFVSYMYAIVEMVVRQSCPMFASSCTTTMSYFGSSSKPKTAQVTYIALFGDILPLSLITCRRFI